MYHIWQYVLQRYDGRKSNYTRTSKIALCCIAFDETYHPHYRIIAKDIFEKEILPRL